MRKQPRRDGQGRLALAGLHRDPGTAIDHAVIEIHMAARRVRNPLQAEDRVMARSGIEPDQYEASKVSIDSVLMPLASFVPSERTGEQACSFRSCEMTLARLRLLG